MFKYEVEDEAGVKVEAEVEVKAEVEGEAEVEVEVKEGDKEVKGKADLGKHKMIPGT